MYIHGIYLVHRNYIYLHSIRYPYSYVFFRIRGNWCRTAGAGPAAPEPPTVVSVCLVSSASSWMLKPAALHAGDLPMCVWVFAALTEGKALVNVQRSSQQTQKYWCVGIIKSVPANIKASTTERASRPCQCMQQNPFLNQPTAFKPCRKFITCITHI